MTAHTPIRLSYALAATICLAVTGPSFAAGGEAPAVAPAVPPQAVRIIDEATGQPQAVEERPMSEVESYCLNIADRAQDARHALQTQQLRDIETQISGKIDELEARRADYQDWIRERRAFLDDASTIVVDIYAQMKADAAAPQLARLGKDNAAMILVRLKPRQASDILSEMDPAAAAEIAKLIVEKTSTDARDEETQTVAESAS